MHFCILYILVSFFPSLYFVFLVCDLTPSVIVSTLNEEAYFPQVLKCYIQYIITTPKTNNQWWIHGVVRGMGRGGGGGIDMFLVDLKRKSSLSYSE